MNQFLQALIRGIGQGSIYALIALGFVIIYQSTRIISFAQPALLLAGATIVSYLSPAVGFWGALGLGIVATAVLGLTVERTALRPMVGKPVFVVAIITIGIDIALRVVINRFIGVNVRNVGDPWGLSTSTVGGVVVQHRYVAMAVALTLVTTVLYLFQHRTRFGLAMRATAFDQEVALAQGINVGRVFAVSWAIAGALAAMAGTFVGAGESISQGSWIIALKALPAIIIGGLDSFGGAVVGGLAVGIVEGFVGTYQAQYFPWLGNNFAIVSPYVLLILVLVVRPYGLWGTPEVERV